MGAVTVAIKRRYYTAGGKNVVADVTWSSTYASGGDTYTPAQFGLATVDAIDCAGASAAGNTGYVVIPDIANSKLKLLGGAASGVALAQNATADMSGTVARVIVHGDDPNI